MDSPDCLKMEWEMKRLKRKSSILFNATLIALFVVGCEKNEPKVHELVGTWVSTGGTIYYGSSVASADSSTAITWNQNGTVTYTFNDDNTASSQERYGETVIPREFTWSTSGSELVLTEVGGSPISNEPVTYVYNLTGNTLTFTFPQPAIDDFPEQWKTMDFQRQ